MRMNTVKANGIHVLRGSGDSLDAVPLTTTVAMLNKKSEPKALFRAWLWLSPSASTDDGVMRLMKSLTRGKDPEMSALNRFLEVCKAENVRVVVKNKGNRFNPSGEREFEIDPSGSEYTPASPGCPIKRQPGESKEQFWDRWNLHRQGIFSVIMREVMDETDRAELDKVDNSKLQMMVDWSLPPERAHALAGGDVAVEVEPDVVLRRPEANAEIATLRADMAALAARVAELESKPSTSNVIEFPRRRYSVTHHRMADWKAEQGRIAS